MAIKDITKTGAQPYQDIQKQNELYEEQNTPWYNLPASQRMQYHQKRRRETLPVEKVGYEEVQQWGDFGNSKYDVDVPLSSLQNLEAWRGENQSAGRQWVHGITKGVGLAATTFSDGTLGLLYGVGQGIVEGRLSALWDNDLSNALQDFNNGMEEWLPNYRTQNEQEKEWWQNMGTANFWADGFLKNLGFSVGAFYSGNAWLKGLKALKWVKNTASAQAVGSLLSGFNEGRIEANNGQRDILNAQYKFIDDEREVMAQEIVANPYNSNEIKIQKLKTLDDNVKIQKDKALERAHQAGMAILIGNTTILTADNMWQLGKLYGKSFANAKGIMGRIEDGMMKQGIRGGIKEGGKYIAETVSKPRAIAKGFSNAFIEGFEELNQAAIAEGAGYWRGVDSPDAYYKALKDPNAQLQTKGFFEALGTGLTNTYGNGDRWEEFAIGFLTGAIGMPTFGRVNNADANTWLGKNKKVGLSGGIIGEYRSQMQQSRENEDAAKVMNSYLDKLATNANYFSQSQSFTNAMDGFAASNNKFEYENMANNDDFAAANRFAKVGRLDEFKELVNQDFENMSDEQLQQIAINTTPNIRIKDDGTVDYEDINGNTATGGWRDATGKLMSETPEGREKMREDLISKRDKMLYEIDEYEKSVEAVRAISNNSLPEDQVNELAWLDWKGKMFNSRYSQVQKKQEENLTGMFNAAQKYSERAARDIETYNSMVNAVKFGIDAVSKDIKDTKATIETLRGNIRNSNDNQASALTAAAINMHRRHIASQEERLSKLQESYDNLKKNTNREKELEFGKYLQDGADEMTKFLGYIKSSDNPLQLAAKIESNEEFIKWAEDGVMKELLTNEMGITGEEYDRIMQDLKDTAMIAKSAKQFKERYDEFAKNPAKLMANRSRIDKAKDKVNSIIDKQKTKKKVKETPISEMVNAVSNGDIDLDDLAAKVEGTSAEDKVNEVKDILSWKDETKDELSKSDMDDAFKDIAILAADAVSGESKEEVLAAFDNIIQDPQTYRDAGIEEENIPQAIADMQEGIKALNEVSSDELNDLNNFVNISKSKPEPKTSQPVKETVGADATTSTPSVQEQSKAQKKADEEYQNTTEFIADRDGQKIAENTLKEIESLGHQVLTEEEEASEIEDTKSILKEVLDAHKEGKSYKEVMDMLSDLFNSDAYDITDITEDAIYDYVDNLYGKGETKTEVKEQQQVTEPVVETHQTTTQEAESYNSSIEKHIDTTEQPRYEYYRPQQSLLPFRSVRTKYDFTPYYRIIGIIYNKESGKELSKEEEAIYSKYHGKINMSISYMKHVIAVGKYLEKVKAFEYVNDGSVQQGDVIGFTIDKELNDAAGDVVVLMTKNGQVVGSLPSLKFDSYTINKTPGLRIFLEHSINQWKKSGKILTQSKVNKYMIGQLPFIEERHTLNEVYGDESFKLGISFNGGNGMVRSEPGVTASEGYSETEQHTMLPLSAAKGQPFLLFETKDKSQRRSYIPIPFIMPILSEATANSELGRAIKARLESLPNYDNNTVMPVLNELKELLSLAGLHINYLDNGNIKIDILKHGNTSQTTIFNQPAANIGSAFESLLRFGIPFQISRRYMNTSFDGKDYNRMIGELANINLAVGSTHTVSNWFTINPVDANGKMIEGNAPVTTMTNPDAHGSISVDWGGSQKYSANIGQEKVYDNAGKEYNGADKLEILAYAEGLKKGYNMEGRPYKSKFGGEDKLFNPITRKFETKPTTTNDVVTSFNAGLQTPSEKGTTRTFTPEQPQAQAPIPQIVYTNDITTKEGTKGAAQYDRTTNTIKIDKDFLKQKFDEKVWTKPRKLIETLQDTTKSISQNKVRELEVIYIGNKEGREIGEKAYTQEGGEPLFDALQRAYDCIDNPNVSERDRDRYFGMLIETAEKYPNNDLAKRIINAVSSTNKTVESQAEPLPEDTFATYEEFEQFVVNHEYQHSLYSREDFNKEFPGKTKGDYETEINRRALEQLKGQSQPETTTPTEPQSEIDKIKASVTEEDNDLMALLNSLSEQVDESPAAPTQETSQEEIRNKARDRGVIFRDARHQKVWEALTLEQQAKFTNFSKLKGIQIWERLLLSYDSTKGFDFDRLGGSVDDILDRKVKFRLAEGQKSEPFNLGKETAWLRKVLPQFSDEEHLRIVNGLTKIGTNTEVYGMFMNGIILLNGSTQTRGTTYHEAFHAVFDTLLTDEERQRIYEAGVKKFNKTGIALEEALAEDFRKYTQGIEYKDTDSRLTRAWRRLTSFIKRLFGYNRTLNQLYADINNGLYADRIPQVTSIVRMSEIESEKRLSDFRKIKEVISRKTSRSINFDTMNAEYHSIMKDANAVISRIREAVHTILPNARVDIILSDNHYYAHIDSIKVNGYQLLDEISRIESLEESRRNSEGYNRSKTNEQRMSEQALVEQGDTFDFDARYREISKTVEDTSEKLSKVENALSNTSSRPKEFSQERRILTEERDNLRYQMRQLMRGPEYKKWLSNFDNLSEADRQALSDYGLTKETWEELNDEGRENALLCFGAF